MLRHACLRVLIADAVGLGKTVQAGLVLAQLLDEGSSRRGLLLMPAGLRHQWQSELAVHFAIDASVCDAAWLRHRARELPPDANPWALPGAYLASFDFIKRPEVLGPIEELLWDLVVVDEAHAVTSGTDRRAAVDAIASRARRVLLLTGTPHSGDEEHFDALCRIGEGPARTPLVMFRRRRIDVMAGAPRRSVLLRVRLSEAERRMHQLLDRYTVRVWRESRARGDRLGRLLTIVLRKRALSSAGSLAASLARRIDLLSNAAGPGALQLALPLPAADEEIEDRVGDDVLGASGLTDPILERRWLGTLLEAARHAARHERKAVRLCRFLSRVLEPAIVFTEYRDTLTRLARALERHELPLLTLHGGLSAGERREVQRTFNDTPSLLLATDAAAEGLNLQRRCRLVVHFELPWNPLRLEQRAGRVDRIGQTRRVHEVALVADDTAERVVLAPLARRAAAAKELAVSGGRMLELLSESRVADAVMAGRADSLPTPAAERVVGTEWDLADEATREALRLAEQRRWLSSERGVRWPGRPAVTAVNARGHADASLVTLVYTLSLVTADGRLIHSEPLVLAIRVGSLPDRVRSAADAIRTLEHALASSQCPIDALIAARRRELACDVVPAHRALVAALRTRELAIADIRVSAARQLVQSGLFDRRALREADTRDAVHRRRAEDARDALDALASADSLTDAAALDAALVRTGRRR
jgi:superfamily II DNA or RNA helicase